MAAPISFNASKCKVYAIVFFMVILAYVVYLFSYSMKKNPVKEHFTMDPTVGSGVGSGGDPNYAIRLTVIDVFDGYMKRNPTPAEITKYSTYQNEQDILQAVMKDFPEPGSAAKKKDAEKLQDDVLEKSNFVGEEFEGDQQDHFVNSEEFVDLPDYVPPKPIATTATSSGGNNGRSGGSVTEILSDRRPTTKSGSSGDNSDLSHYVYVARADVQKIRNHLQDITDLVDKALAH